MTPSQALILTRSPSQSPPRRQPLSLLPASISRGNELWHPVLHVSNQVVLYNPHSHALSITSAPTNGPAALSRPQRWSTLTGNTTLRPCPYCKQNLPQGFHCYSSEEEFQHSGTVNEVDDDEEEADRWETVIDNANEGEDDTFELVSTDPAYHSRAFNYFRLLAVANDASSQASGSKAPSHSPSSSTEDDVRSGRRTRSKRRSRGRSPSPVYYRSESNAFPSEKMAEGYFNAFFQEEYRLGMGANGSVFLCQHVLDGNSLGHFAVKKIAVGESHVYLYKILKEVRLLERLRHPNIVTYHHAWLETHRFSSFGPKVPTLFVLMQWAEGGSLDDFIDVRLGRKPAHDFMYPFYTPHSDLSASLGVSAPASPMSSNQGDLAQENEVEIADMPTQTTRRRPQTSFPDDMRPDTLSSSQTTVHPTSNVRKEDLHSRSARIRAFRAYQHAPPEEKQKIRREMEDMIAGSTSVAPAALGERDHAGGSPPGRNEWMAVHLLSADEVKSLFRDVVEGLAFLHSKSILHLDLKPGNVLLTWDEGQLIPRAMLSDFGTSRDMIHSSMSRSGNTGTLEYAAPESLPSPQTGLLQHIDSKADMWSLGMILHKLLFFKLPYRYAADGDANDGATSQTEGEEKFVRLEKEILAYPGFKFTPVMVTGFGTRKLPRTFLVLLENLLHISPTGRSSCERVLTAIREGKFDPLVNVSNSTLSVARSWTTEAPPPTVPHSSPATGVDPALPVGSSEKLPMLALPPPPVGLPAAPEDERRQARTRWQAFKTWWDTETGRKERRYSAMVAMKLVRSSLLVAKVLTIRRICPDPLTHPRPFVSAFLLALAICDTALDHDDWKRRIREESEGGNGDYKGENRAIRWSLRTSAVLHALSRVGSGIWITVALTLFHFLLVGLNSVPSESEGGLRSLQDLWSRACCVGMADW